MNCKLLLLDIIMLSLSCPLFAQYKGTASVTKGLATITASNLYTCSGGRTTNLGSIKASDNTTWTVPAVVNFADTNFPFSSDLNNICNGANYSTEAAALAALNGSDIIVVDSSGEVITGFIFADNYFEIYINGVPVGKDKVPYTQFNSSIVRFKVKRPFTIAMLLVDWEEHLGVGAENSNGFQYHIGDGGMVAVFKDSKNKIVAITGNDWKAQTFYTSPVKDLTCPTEIGNLRLSNNCDTKDSNDGTNYYGLHWNRPANWTKSSFDDSKWPSATTYSNGTIGVDNKPAYTNFIHLFDDPSMDAQFIWSTNVVLDNEVIVRYTVGTTTTTLNQKLITDGILIYPNPATQEFDLDISSELIRDNIRSIRLYNTHGKKIYESKTYSGKINLEFMPKGFYIVQIEVAGFQFNKKILLQ